MGVGGNLQATSDAAHIAKATLHKWLNYKQFGLGVRDVFGPQYMRPPTSPELDEIRENFFARRGIPGVALAVDGTHVPYVPEIATARADYMNYKGWSSVAVVAFVNSFYMFQQVEVGHPGRASDLTITRESKYMSLILSEPERFLGSYCCIVGDGGYGGSDEKILTPYPTPMNLTERWFNFCHSSTRFFVEQVFGIWKNKFRFTLHASDLLGGVVNLPI